MISLIDDLICCTQCNQWREQLIETNCCKYKFCSDCIAKQNHKCPTPASSSYDDDDDLYTLRNNDDQNQQNHRQKNSPESQPISIDKRKENLYSSYLAVHAGSSLNSFSNFSSSLSDFAEDNSSVYSTNGGSSIAYMADDGSTFDHIVSEKDTLQGLSIRYNCSVEELKLANKLTSDSIRQRYILMIPKKKDQQPQQKEEILNDKEMEEVLMKRVVSRFMKRTGCTDPEQALYFLEKSSFDFFKSVVDFQNSNFADNFNDDSQYSGEDGNSVPMNILVNNGNGNSGSSGG
eukprot:gene8293-10189_t